ncbi:hypothetical protein CDL12_27945 [Handroanthus impetiginosus]|uniref:RPM1 interacting protein 13 n=1 Tax=Handroanthus impetiginosus TaxID=429701 RepID=A0A2G9G2M7_9LAMI|nr:hypothetical protein CDL12_27945 [Handroanthus impetiginosus]
MGTNYIVNKPEVQKISSMAGKEREVIEIDDSCPSPDPKGTPLRHIFCLKNRDEVKKFEESEDCFILDFDPYDDQLNVSFSKDFDNADSDLRVVAEKGQLACRDYPHPRHTCAKYPFEKTPHDIHCKLCYCYVCDLSAPCSKWVGSSGHCHAFNNEAWNKEKKVRRQLAKSF